MQPVKRLLTKPSYKLYAIIVALLSLTVFAFHYFDSQKRVPVAQSNASTATKNKAYYFYRVGEYQKAIPKLRAYLESHNDDVSTRNLLIASYNQTKRFDLAEREADANLKNSGNDPNNLLLAAHSAIQAKNYNHAETLLKQGLESNSDDLRFHFKLAEVYTLIEDYDSSVDRWKAALNLLKRSDPRVPFIRKKTELNEQNAITGFEAGDYENGQSTLTWSYAPDNNVTAVRILRRADGFLPTDPFDPKAQLVYEDTSQPTATAFVDTLQLKNSHKYRYAIFVKSSASNKLHGWSNNAFEYINADNAIPGPTLSVIGNTFAVENVCQGQTRIALASLSLKTDFSTAILSRLTVKKTSNSNISNLSKLRVFKDTDRNGRLDRYDIQIGSADTKNLSTPIQLKPMTISKKPLQLLVAGDIQPDADVSQKTSAVIEGSDSIEAAGISRITVDPVLPVGPFSVKGNSVNVASSSNVSFATRGHTAVVMQKLNLCTDYAESKLKAISISKTGTVPDRIIPRAAIYDDRDGNGLINDGERQLCSSFFTNGKTRIVFNEPQTITAKPRFFLIAYDISQNAGINDLVGSKIASAESIELETPDMIKTTKGKATGFSGKIAKICVSTDKISLSHNPPKIIKGKQGSSDLLLDRISISAPPTGDGAIIKSFRMNQIGTADDKSVSVKLIVDSGKIGVYEPGADIVIGKTAVRNGSALFRMPDSWIVDPGSSRHLLLAATISEEAKLGATVQSRISNQTYIETAAPDKTYPFINAEGCTIEITDKPDTLFVEQNLSGPDSVRIGSKDKVAQVIALSVNSDKAILQRLRLHLSGNLPINYIDDAKLWLDSNRNKKVDKDDRLLTKLVDFTRKTMDFKNITMQAVSRNQPVQLLVTASISMNAPIYKKLSCTMNNSSDIIVATPDKASIKYPPKQTRIATITTAPQIPTAPDNIQATAKTDRHITVSWNSNRSKQDVTGYKVFRSASKYGPFSQIGSTKNGLTKYADAVPKAGTYWYKIAAVNVSGESTSSVSQTTDQVQMERKISAEESTATIRSADNSLTLFVPKNKAYDKKTFRARSAVRPTGSNLKLISKHYFEFETDAKEPFDPPLTIMLRCNKPVDDSIKIYHYKNGEWQPVTGGQYIYDDYYIGYTNITSFSGYGAVQTDTASGYNNPPQYTDGPKGPHGGYVNGSNKCKECHSVHLADGLFRLTRANERDEACDYCHGIGGMASTTIALDENGHGVSSTATADIVAPDDTDPPYSVSTTKWGCLECHSAHGNQTVELAGFSTDRLLKSNPNRGKSFLYYTPEVGETTQTVSQWCTSCHNANFGPSSDPVIVDGITTVFGHSVSSTGMTVDGEGYAEVDPNDGLNKGPTCRQCHIAESRLDITTGFPHASGSAASLLETDTVSTKIDNTCVACHKVSSLP